MSEEEQRYAAERSRAAGQAGGRQEPAAGEVGGGGGQGGQGGGRGVGLRPRCHCRGEGRQGCEHRDEKEDAVGAVLHDDLQRRRPQGV